MYIFTAKSQEGKANKTSPELRTPSELTIHIGVGVKRLQMNKKDSTNQDSREKDPNYQC